LQFSWAAMAGYCEHENALAAKHAGHHSHDHATVDHSESGQSSAQLSCMDHDCAACHLGCAAPLVSDLNTTTAAVSDAHPLHLQATSSQLSSERPERPKWPLLA
jgi:hypothetical protein